MPVGGALKGVRGAEHPGLAEMGTDDLQPDRQALYKAFRYMVIGSAVLAPSGNAGVGVVGPMSTSTLSNALMKSALMSARTRCALR